MRNGISFTVSADDRERLRGIVADPKSPQKHVWRARIVLLSGDGLGTSAIMTEVDGFKMLNGRFPTNDEGVEVLDMPGGVPTDPWGNRYEYNSPAGNGRPYEVFTLGQDAQEGGDGIDADIYSWQLQQPDETAQP